MVEPNDWYSTRTHRSSYTRPSAPDKKNSRLYARAALERMQLAQRGDEILHLWQDEILEARSVADERVGRGHPLHGRVEPWEALVGEPRRDHGLPVERRQAPQIDHRHAHPVRLLELLRGHERALHQGAVGHDRQVAAGAHPLRLAERDHEVRPGVRRLVVGLAIE